jgi:hypothetical protein
MGTRVMALPYLHNTQLGGYSAMVVDQDSGVSPTAAAQENSLASPAQHPQLLHHHHSLSPSVAHQQRARQAGPMTPRFLPTAKTGAAEALVTLGTPLPMHPASALLSPQMSPAAVPNAGRSSVSDFPTPEAYQAQESLDDVRDAVRLFDSMTLTKLDEYDNFPPEQRKHAYGAWYQVLLASPPELRLLSLVNFPFTKRISEVVSREMPDLFQVPMSFPQRHANFGHQGTHAPPATQSVSDGFHLTKSSTWDRHSGLLPQPTSASNIGNLHPGDEEAAAAEVYQSQLYQQVPPQQLQQPRRGTAITSRSSGNMYQQMQRLKMQKLAEEASQRKRKHDAEEEEENDDEEEEADDGKSGKAEESAEDEEDEEPDDPAYTSPSDLDEHEDSDQDSQAYRGGQESSGETTGRKTAKPLKPRLSTPTTTGPSRSGGVAKAAQKPRKSSAPKADGNNAQSRHQVVGRPVICFDAHPELCEDFREGEALFTLPDGGQISCHACLWLEPVDIASLLTEGAAATPRRRVFVYATEFAQKFFSVTNNHARALNPIPNSGMCKIGNSNFISANGVREAVKLCKQFRESKVRDRAEQQKYIKEVLQAVCGPMDRFEAGRDAPEFALVMTSNPVKATTLSGGGGAGASAAEGTTKPAKKSTTAKRARKSVKSEADEDEDQDTPMVSSHASAGLLPFATASSSVMPFPPALPGAPMPFNFDAKQMLTFFLNSGAISTETAAEVLRERTGPKLSRDPEAVMRAARLAGDQQQQ